ncbi:MAG TPA: L,D-transpeptidase [Acidimicrobiales bacterium]|nr:L,D-transpeptidase [Acidimicrobiales bacterium]
MRKLVVVAAALVVALSASACGSSAAPPAAAPTTATTVAPTTTTLPSAPPGEFLVAMPVTGPLPYSATEGGAVAGTLPATTWGDQTVRPVISQTPDWIQVGLDTRPDGATGWVPRSSITLAATPYRIVVSISQRRLTLYKDGQSVYTSLVGVGAPQYPTPLGTTFVDAIVATPKSQLYIYGPTVLILGTHSNVLTDFDGGNGTVAIHGYPSAPSTTDGVADSHGCVRASPETISALQIVPLGTPVEVVA